jgi:Ca2+-binding EF-hand superfamily protein
MNTRSWIAGAALIAIPAATFAGEDPAPARSSWDAFSKRFDLDTDGRVTWEEYQKVASGFAGLDKNRDGAITKDEVPAAGGAFAEALALGGPLGLLEGAGAGGFPPVVVRAWGGVGGIAGDDEGPCFGGICGGAGADGVFGLDAKHAPWIAFAMLGASADADRDGAITTAEWETMLTSLHADGAGVVPTESLQKALPDVPAAAAGAVLSMLLDLDKDGRIELDDLRAAFTAVDTDRDGRVDSKDKPQKDAAK